MNGTLRLILNHPLNGKYVKQFRNENYIINIISVYCEEEEFWFSAFAACYVTK